MKVKCTASDSKYFVVGKLYETEIRYDAMQGDWIFVVAEKETKWMAKRLFPVFGSSYYEVRARHTKLGVKLEVVDES